jgi:hypothetical protein
MRRSRAALCVIVGLLAGLAGETLLFAQRQCRAVEAGLTEDFRILLFLREEADEGRLKVLEEQLRALPDVEDARAVSREEQLAALRRDDPELVESVALLGENPLTPAFEVRLAEGGVARIAQWLTRAQPLADWADVRYKPAQAQAILQAQFYSRFLDLAMACLVCLAAAMTLAGLWSSRRPTAALQRREAWEAAAYAAGGAIAGAAVVCVMVLPMRAAVAFWAWPPAAGQAALLMGSAAAGWVLCARAE